MPRRAGLPIRRRRSSVSMSLRRCSAGRSWRSRSSACSRAGSVCVTALPPKEHVSMVDLILLERVEKLGQMGQVVKVRPGYARNYLLPQKKALRATKQNLSYFESRRAQLEATNLQQRGEAEQLAQKLQGLSVVLLRQ